MSILIKNSILKRCLSKSLKNTFSLLSTNNFPSNEKYKPFYALGFSLINPEVRGELIGMLKKEEIEVMLNGFNDSMLDKVTNDDALLIEYGPKLNEILNNRAIVAEKIGEDFRNNYLKTNPNAIKTKSGLIYHETLAGTGKHALSTSSVKIHYNGILATDNTVFGSTFGNEPIDLPLKNVITGWQEGVALMKVGGKCTLVIPPNLAYGNNGSPQVNIPPYSTLIFQLELIEILDVVKSNNNL